MAVTDDRQVLQSAGRALGLQLIDLQLDQLMAYRDALLKWNKVYNLTAIRQPQEMLQQHLDRLLGHRACHTAAAGAAVKGRSGLSH